QHRPAGGVVRTSNCQFPNPKGMATKNTMLRATRDTMLGSTKIKTCLDRRALRGLVFVPFVAVLLVAFVANSRAAGKSDIADAAMRGDAAAVQGLIGKKGEGKAARPAVLPD